jgi:hypothetical protein
MRSNREEAELMGETTRQCSVCGSSKVIPEVTINDKGFLATYDLAIEIQGKPDALVFREPRLGVLMAAICGECGHVDLTAKKPHLLWKTYRKQQDARQQSSEAVKQ